jgi:hypothetical protein
MTYRHALLAFLAAPLAACIVVQEPAPTPMPQPRPIPEPQPQPDPQPAPGPVACEPSGPILYRETRRPLYNDAVPHQQFTIYQTGAIKKSGESGTTCLSEPQLESLRGALTAARMASAPQITCKAMPYLELRVTIDAIGSVTWKAPCSATPDAETLRGIELARAMIGVDR